MPMSLCNPFCAPKRPWYMPASMRHAWAFLCFDLGRWVRYAPKVCFFFLLAPVSRPSPPPPPAASSLFSRPSSAPSCLFQSQRAACKRVHFSTRAQRRMDREAGTAHACLPRVRGGERGGVMGEPSTIPRSSPTPVSSMVPKLNMEVGCFLREALLRRRMPTPTSFLHPASPAR